MLKDDPRFKALPQQSQREIAITYTDRGDKAALEQLERLDIAARVSEPIRADYGLTGARFGTNVGAPDLDSASALLAKFDRDLAAATQVDQGMIAPVSSKGPLAGREGEVGVLIAEQI